MYIMEKIVRLTEENIRSIIKEVLHELYETSACLGASYGEVRHLAHDVKAGDPDAIDRAALLMSKYVPPRSVVIPIPQHTGQAEYTLKLAKRIAHLSKATVLNVLTMELHSKSMYLQKQQGKNIKDINLGLSAYYDERYAEQMKSARNVILIDNVIDSGTTYEQSREAIKQTYGVDAWLLSLGAVTEPKDKSRDVIRSIYPTYRLHEENEGTNPC